MEEINERPVVKITKLIVIEARQINQPVYGRAYSVNGNLSALDKLRNVMADNMHGPYAKREANLTEIDLALKVPEIININPMPTAVDIVNGWNTNRGRFLLEATSYSGGIMYKSYLQGYTDYLDNSYTGKLDPQMMLHINSVILTSSIIDPVSGIMRTNNLDFYNVLPNGYDDNQAVYEQLTDMNMVKKIIRPEDVLGSIFLLERYSNDGSTVINTADDLGPNKISRRKNNEMYNYFKSITNAFIDSKNTADVKEDRDDILHNASAIVAEPDITRNPLLRAIYYITGNFLVSKIMLKTLKELDPDLRPTFVPRQSVNPIVSNSPTFMDSDNTADMRNPSGEVIRAHIICNMLASFMCDDMITALSISMTNETGENVALISNVNSFIDGVDPGVQINRILSKVKNILMPKITDGGITRLEVFVTADILGDMTVAISLYGNPITIFRFPCYADGLYSPVVTVEGHKKNLINDFQNVLETTYDI